MYVEPIDCAAPSVALSQGPTKKRALASIGNLTADVFQEQMVSP
jgi:hypothetical protein